MFYDDNFIVFSKNIFEGMWNYMCMYMCMFFYRVSFIIIEFYIVVYIFNCNLVIIMI